MIGCWGQGGVGLGDWGGKGGEVRCSAQRGAREGQLDWEIEGQLCLGLAGPQDSGNMHASYVPTHYSRDPSAWLSYEWKGNPVA